MARDSLLSGLSLSVCLPHFPNLDGSEGIALNRPFGIFFREKCLRIQALNSACLFLSVLHHPPALSKA